MEKVNEQKYSAIKEVEDVPSQLGGFKIYVNWANPMDEGGRTCIYIYIKHVLLFKVVHTIYLNNYYSI